MTDLDALLGPLPEPEVLHELHDAPCPACHTMLRTLPPLKMGYTADQLRAERERAYAAGVAAERERCAKLCEHYADALEKVYDAGGGLDGDLSAIGCARAFANRIRAAVPSPQEGA